MAPEIMTTQSVQETYAPNLLCFGCGPKNQNGLRIRSFREGDELVCTWRAQPHHEAYVGMLNGGIIGALLDCHSNWTAALHLMDKQEQTVPPCTVTAEFTIKLMCPTPSQADLFLRAQVVESTHRRAVIKATLTAEGNLCATCDGTFVAVKKGHPAYHRWG